MTATPSHASKAGATRAVSRYLLLAAGFIAVLLGAVLAWRWLTPPAPEPPAVSAEGVDPVVFHAVEAARARVRAAPRSGEAWGRLGLLLYSYSFHPEAVACFAIAERLDPREPRWPYLHGLMLTRGIAVTHGETDAAGLTLLERAAELCGNEPDAPRLTLAELLVKEGRLDEAETHFRKVLALDFRNPRVHLGLARAAAGRDDLPGALGHLRECEDSPFTRKAALLLKAEIQDRLGEREESREALRQADASGPDARWPDPFLDEVEDAKVDQRALRQRGRQALSQGRKEEAEELFDRVKRDFPDSDDWAQEKELWQREDFAGAEQVLRRITRKSPDEVDGHYALGMVLLREQNAAGAAECFRRVLRLQPDHAAAYEQLGEALSAQGDRAGALEALRTAVRYLPQKAETQRRLGELLAQEGRDAEALEHLRLALHLNPDDPKAKALIEQINQRTLSPPRS